MAHVGWISELSRTLVTPSNMNIWNVEDPERPCKSKMSIPIPPDKGLDRQQIYWHHSGLGLQETLSPPIDTGVWAPQVNVL